jgi:hypothetical protein
MPMMDARRPRSVVAMLRFWALLSAACSAESHTVHDLCAAGDGQAAFRSASMCASGELEPCVTVACAIDPAHSQPCERFLVHTLPVWQLYGVPGPCPTEDHQVVVLHDHPVVDECLPPEPTTGLFGVYVCEREP